eukprot:397382-Pyramimonas_sp.AAC.1
MLALDKRSLSRRVLQLLPVCVSMVTASPIARDCSKEGRSEADGGRRRWSGNSRSRKLQAATQWHAHVTLAGVLHAAA